MNLRNLKISPKEPPEFEKAGECFAPLYRFTSAHETFYRFNPAYEKLSRCTFAYVFTLPIYLLGLPARNARARVYVKHY